MPAHITMAFPNLLYPESSRPAALADGSMLLKVAENFAFFSLFHLTVYICNPLELPHVVYFSLNPNLPVFQFLDLL